MQILLTIVCVSARVCVNRLMHKADSGIAQYTRSVGRCVIVTAATFKFPTKNKSANKDNKKYLQFLLSVR